MELLCRTEIRGRAVWCRWREGRLTGDPEILRRVGVAGDGAGAGPDLSTPSAALRALRDALASPIDIEIVDAAADPGAGLAASA